MKVVQVPSPPTKKERFTLRLMITIGLICIGYFLNNMMNPAIVGSLPLYWMLLTTFIFMSLKAVHEWIHYFFITIPKTPESTKVYTVDVFTTFCAGEPYEMIEETLIAIKAITYPHETYLCDEANDPYLKNFCEELGVHHITRTKKINAKAGNINNALSLSSGELCLVLDPDHVPLPNFLDPIVTHFNNPEVGFVQIVQSYYNNDENLIAKGAAQQTYQFYGPMMMTMNKYGTVLAIGANCTFRRAALESIGGHAAGLAEDMHTAMQLHSKGWKSVYVPLVLARGLVPSTLSAYYKQQLKWSRGVFDLLVTAYPKLFKGFTWQQKLHYAVIPLHYFSGVIYLINFLIPIVSLFFDVSPIKMSITTFGITVLPLVTMTLLIRHFVQKWVMEDEERGFHVVGGLLMIGTWWIFILGLVYTIIGKKVPYVPTPKDGNEANNWPLNVPNLVVLALSLIAIVYGLYYDWNPYNIIMAGFAGLNSLIMCFNIIASRQQQFRAYKAGHSSVNGFMDKLKEVKIKFWYLRRRIYAGVRSTALIITMILCFSVLYFANSDAETKEGLPVLNHKMNYFLTGVFAPESGNGISTLKKVKQLQRAFNTKFDLVSIYIPWGDESQCYLPQRTVDSIYNNGSIPMVTWEPWQNLFAKNEINGKDKKDLKVFRRVLNGDYDGYLKKFSDQIKALNRPVYLRFAHEMDNPSYPWSPSGDNTPDEYRTAWKYIHQYFSKNAVYNVIWVWNPWKPETVDAYFPGMQYVDWIGVTNLNYGKPYSASGWQSMEDLYKYFHQNPIFRSGLPVMLAEMGSLVSAGRQQEWFQQAFKSKNKYPEIKGFLFFDSGYDKNVPKGGLEMVLNWRIQQPEEMRRLLKENHKGLDHPVIAKTPLLLTGTFSKTIADSSRTKDLDLFAAIKGVNYNRGQDWKKNYQTVTMRDMVADFEEMKQIGVNTIKRYGPDIYDSNLLRLAKKTGMNIHYGYWVSDELNFQSDIKGLDLLSDKILASVTDLKDEESIKSWNIGNAVFQKLDLYYYKPELVYQQDAYLFWLRKLIVNIKKIDPKRPVTVDIEVSENTNSTIERYSKVIPEIDLYGLVVGPKVTEPVLVKNLEVPWFYSEIPLPSYNSLNDTRVGTFIANWQDERKTDRVTLDGIKDTEGRKKLAFSQLFYAWNKGPLPANKPSVKILKPALGTFPGHQLTYHVIVKKDNQWVLASALPQNLTFEWKLAKLDRFNKPVSMSEVGKGESVKVVIPENPMNYRLYLYVIKENVILDIIESKLNTPLKEK
ncbi:glycosyltransferase [Pedobacter sp. PLR]|uniref:glycosyltransferase family 2 protein n=1 Tax=Pedobacter sp. PLR TaxID=2994465 RepID=UPI002248486A|nr:glycosyltransferase family 2 protein [Pedobacter sp. PLR]MCX2453777.1 glycosyltransferase [Pedobacter sp. PLR]